jgi:oxygen-dependent protoporphyrinogen oxidase
VSEKLHYKVAVIGGGVSGMAAASCLARQGHQVDLYESSDRLGGRMALSHLQGREICLGGKNIGFHYKEFRRFLAHYGKPKYEYFGLNSARLSNGKVLPFNSKKKREQFLTLLRSTTILDLWKLRRAWRAVQADRANGDLSGPYFKALVREGSQTLTDYFSGKFSKSIARALTVRMNGAEPDQITLENFGTHLQMLQDEYEQITSPLENVFSAFQADPDIQTKLRTSVKALRNTNGFYALTGDGFMELYSKVIIALPAYGAAKLTKSDFPGISRALRQPRYFPVTVIVAKYERPVFETDLRALTFPPNSALSNIGAYGINDLNWVRYTFSGAAAQALNSHSMPDAQLLSIAEKQGLAYFHLDGNSCQAFKRRSWERGLCGYTLNESKFRSDLRDAQSEFPGLYFTGDYIKGASIENCFRAAKETVENCLSSAPRPPKSPDFHVDLKRDSLCPK